MHRATDLVCIGDISVDTLIALDHLPRHDEKQWAVLIGDFPGGMAANVAVTFTRLGGRAKLIAQVGHDLKGEFALDSLRSSSIDVSQVSQVSHPTFWTLSLVDKAGERSMIEFASPAINPPWSSIGAHTMGGVGVVYTIGSATAGAVDVFRACNARGTITALDVDFDEIDSAASLKDLLEFTTLLFCNSETACRLAEAESPEQAAHRLAGRGPATVVVTRGKLGALAVDRVEGEAHASGHDVAVVDSTGAGDCFAGAYLFGQVREWKLAAKLEFANVMAALSTTAYGCQSGIPSLPELVKLPIARGMLFHKLLTAQKEKHAGGLDTNGTIDR